MSPVIIDIAIALCSLALFGACYAAALLATRPGRPRPSAATPDLGDEPPAVVNLLGNGWALNEDAVEATLLDLAARRYLELRQPGSDPRQTTVHLRPDGDAVAGTLTRYEQRVLERVRGLAVNGVLPISALTFRDKDQERGWERRFRSEVITDAKARGLTRRRFDAPVISLLEIVAVVTSIGLAAALAHWESWGEFDEDSKGIWVPAGFAAFIALSVVVGSIGGQRHTPAGLAAAARWLGVREWLRGHEQFAQLPPAAVMVWDRYLPYGAALGVTRTASEVLDLGMADRKRVWSSYGGGWHRVRVRYPRRGAHYGLPGGKVLSGGVMRVAFGIGLLWLRSELLPQLGLDYLLGHASVNGTSLAGGERVLSFVMLAIGGYLLVRGGYWLLRGALDLAGARSITGEVLWLAVWRKTAAQNGRPAVAALHYLAIDDGSGDRTTAWALSPALAVDVHTGDTVTIRVRPWTRRVVELRRVARGSAAQLAEAQAQEERAEAMTASGPPAARQDATSLLTADEVGQALGMRVRESPPFPTPGVSVASYSDDRGTPVLMVQLAGGTTARWIWRLRSLRGRRVRGIGEHARLHEGQLAVRVGELTVVMVLVGDGRRAESALPWLAQRAVGRVHPPALPQPHVGH